jgi:hypothetical protein
MTQISTIHGIPFNEYSDRGANVAAKAFFPYLSMTAGQLELSLLRQRAQIYRQFAPDMPVYSQAINMIDQALKNGTDGVNYIGAIPNDLQPLAATITNAVRRTQPASRAGNYAKIGVIPLAERYKACLDAAKTSFEKLKCGENFNIEKILNDGIERSGHHLLYKSLPREYAVPSDVSTKRILHQTGVEGMALVGELPTDLMYLWVENGVILKNVQNKIGPLGSATSSLYLAPDPQQAVDAFKGWQSGQSSAKRDKIKAGGIGGIAIDPITAGVIIAVVGALTAAFDMLKEMRKQKAYAMIQAQGFGTQAFSANTGDWQGSPVDNNNNNLLLLGGAAAALYFLSDN